MGNQTAKKNIHAGHRERVRENVLKNGFEQLEDHRLLELLLFYSIPREDTNELAHRLLDEFGSLSEVIKASPSRLARVSGIGESSAILLSSIGELCMRVLKEGNVKRTPYKSQKEIIDLVKSHYLNEEKERFLIICFDANMRMKRALFISEGDSMHVDFDIKTMLSKVLEFDATFVVLAHNHPDGEAFPSGADIDTTGSVSVMLRRVGAKLYDHIIIGGDSHFSMRDSSLFSNLFDE